MKVKGFLIMALSVIVIMSSSILFGGTYTQNYSFTEPDIIYNEDKTVDVLMDNTISHYVFGEPMLPMLTAKILIHRDEDVMRVYLTNSGETYLPGEYFVSYGKRQEPTEKDFSEVLNSMDSDIDMDIYTSNNWYPEISNTEGSYQYLRGTKIFIVNLYPVQYQPASGKIKYYSDMTLTLETVPNTPSAAVMSYRMKDNDDAAIVRYVDNPENLLWYHNSVPIGDRNITVGGKNTLTYQYLVITNNALYSVFSDFADWKATTYGLTTYVETVENIYANYSGEDNPAKIRNFIKDSYTQCGTEYVLLGGDGDGANSNQNAVVPHRGLYGSVNAGGTTDNDIASDLYYGCLDGVFNYDGDNKYGETNDGDGGGDVDMLYDVYIGRICAQTETEASNHLNKIMDYKSDPSPYKALLIGEQLDAITQGSDYKEAVYAYMNEIPKTTLYQDEGTFSKTAVINAINSNTHSVLNHMGHANVTTNMGLNTGDTASLTNTTYLWAYTQGCYCGSFDNRNTDGTYNALDCMGEYFTAKNAAGFAAYIGNSRYGWYSPGSTNGTSNIFDMEIMKSVFWEDIMNIGHSLADSKEALIGNSGSYGAYRWVYFELNLLGCPHMLIKLDCPDDVLMISNIYPPEDFVAKDGDSMLVKARVVDGCGDYVTGLNVSATFSNGDSSITLDYNGDGYYAGYWTPQHLGACTLTINSSGAGYSSDTEYVIGFVTDDCYCNINGEYEWIDATSGTPLNLGDESIVSINIGFDFSYYGTEYTQVGVSSNGYLKFGSLVNDWENQCMPNTLQPNNLIALYWDDLNPAYNGGKVYYKIFGTQPNRYLVVEWHNVYLYGVNTSPGTFEVILYEGSNEIKFQYQDVNFGNSGYDYGARATIGVESNGGTLATEYSCNDPSLTDRMAILFQDCYESNRITLESFDAGPSFDGVILSWKTGTEVDNLGFYIVRSENLDKGYVLLNKNIIPARGNVYSGAEYEYIDSVASFGHVYYYWLLDVDIYGDMKVHGPSKVVTYLVN